jgi:hypothetical protein
MKKVSAHGGIAARLLLLLALVLPLSAAAKRAPEQPRSTTIEVPRPGSRAAATYDPRLRFVEPKLGGVFSRSQSGLYLPDHRLIQTSPKQRLDQARWHGIGRSVVRYLERGGARLSPQPYQDLVGKIRNRAEYVLRRDGKSLSSWKMMVIEGGQADQVNAAAWTGGVITIFRPLVDLCYQIANVTVNSNSTPQLDAELWRLSRWRRDKRSPVPETLKLSRDNIAARDRIAESILSYVLLHEMGHAASGHVELKDRELYIPGKDKPRDLARSRDHEREADLFASTLGVKGAVRAPGAMPLFTYYNFISRPTFAERDKHRLDWRTHPIDAERFNNQLEVLSAAKRGSGLKPLEPRIILPSGEYATPNRKPAEVVPIRPPTQQLPLDKAAARAGL